MGLDADRHDLATHLYAATLQLMRELGQAFLPLEVVQRRLGWPQGLLGEVVDHCVRTDPVTAEGLRAHWMDDGGRPSYGTSGQRFIGIRAPLMPSAGADPRPPAAQ